MSADNDNEAPTPRDIGRGWAYELQTQAEAEGEKDRWFEELYARAEGDPGYIPWENAAPRFRLEEWLTDNPGKRRTAIDVGCGLGDNAACLAAAGYATTAFDLSDTAAVWAAKRFTDLDIQFRQADLFDLPAEWRGAFDLVHETYNLQALPQDRVPEAIKEIATLVRPGGTLLVMTRSRAADETPSGPPWPLTRATLEEFTNAGLTEVTLEPFHDQRSDPIAHFLGIWTRPNV